MILNTVHESLGISEKAEAQRAGQTERKTIIESPDQDCGTVAKILDLGGHLEADAVGAMV